MKQVTNNPDIFIEDGLIVVHKNNAGLVFSSEDSIKSIVGLIRREVAGHEPDLTTVKGRKAIASLANQVSKSKVILDALGKDLVAEWKEQAKVVDQARKIARDDLDALRDETRKPLTEWEEEQDRIALEEQKARQAEADAADLACEIERCHGEALLEDEVQILRKEKAERDRIEAQRLQEAKIRDDERKRVEQESQDKIRQAQFAAENKIKDAQRELERREMEERDRLARVERERQIAASNAAAAEEEKRRGEEARAANKHRQGQINRAAAEAIILAMSEADTGNGKDAKAIAKAIVTAIAKGEVPNVTINY